MPFPTARSCSWPGTARRRWMLAAGVLGAFTLALVVLVEARWHPLAAADRRVSARLHTAAVENPGWTRANRILTDWVWDPVTMRGAALVAALWLAVVGVRRLACWMAATTAAGVAVQYTIRAATARPRPSYPDPVDSAYNYALPSGHVTAATLTCGLLLTLLALYRPARRWTAAAWTLAALSVTGVAFTRVFLGVHWPTDTLAGWLTGGLVLAACTAWFSPWRTVPPRKTAGRRQAHARSAP